MIKRMVKALLSAGLLAVLLVVIGLFISYIFIGSLKYLSIILFVLGAIPIVVFSSGIFGRSASGAVHTPKVIYRVVATLTPKKYSSYDTAEAISNLSSTLTWIITGMIVWLISYFV